MGLFSRNTFQNCTDVELMQYVAKGNSRAFEILYERYNEVIFRFFYRMLWQNSALAEDYTQDVFLKIIEKPQLFNANNSFRTWIYAMARNKCKNAYRDKKQVENIELVEDENLVEEFSESIDKDVFDKQLLCAIENLDLIHKECFVLRFHEDLPIRSIAEILDIPEGTVKSRIHFATKKVAAQLQWCKEIFE